MDVAVVLDELMRSAVVDAGVADRLIEALAGGQPLSEILAQARAVLRATACIRLVEMAEDLHRRMGGS